MDVLRDCDYKCNYKWIEKHNESLLVEKKAFIHKQLLYIGLHHSGQVLYLGIFQ